MYTCTYFDDIFKHFDFVMVCWFSGCVKAKLLHLVFDMPTRLTASITLECNDAVTIYEYYLHPFQHVHLNYTNLKRSIDLAEIST